MRKVKVGIAGLGRLGRYMRAILRSRSLMQN